MEIVWNKTALTKLDQIIDYLLEEASEKAARSFYEKVIERIEMLSRYPEVGRKSKKKKTVRMFPIDKYRNLYYRIEGRKLIIVYLFDARQYPDQNPY